MTDVVDEFKKDLKRKAEHLIKHEIPDKILELNRIVECVLARRSISEIHQEINIPTPPPVLSAREKRRILVAKTKTPRSKRSSDRVAITPTAPVTINDPIPCNTCLADLINVVKPQVRQLLEDTNLLKMWMNLMIPGTEEANNYGVGIQEIVLNKIELVEKFAALLFGYTSVCFVARGEIMSKVATYPHVNDYRRAVAECDENNYRYMCKMLRQVRDFYCSLHDVVCKNFDRLKNTTGGVKAMCI